MASPSAPPAEPAQQPSSRQIAAGTAVIEDLLNALDNGVRVTGMLLSAEKPEHRAGVSGKGKSYDFWNQRFQVWTGNKAVECVLRRDKESEFPPVQVGTKVSFRVTNISMFNGQPRFDIEA